MKPEPYMISQNNKITKALPMVIERNKWCKENKQQFKKYAIDVDE